MGLLTTVLLLLSVYVDRYCDAQGHFVKDQNVDGHQFPPRIEEPIKGLPRGHLRPLGYQKLADGKVIILSRKTTNVQFHQRVKDRRSSFVLPTHYFPPAMDMWGDKYLNANFGREVLNVTLKPSVKNITHELMTMKSFLKQYHYHEWLIRSLVPTPMLNNLTVPHALQCPSETEYLQSVEMWLSSGPSSSLLFYRADDQLHCWLQGRGDLIVIEETHRDTLKAVEQHYKYSGEGESHLDVEVVNVYENPKVAQVPWQWASLRKSDCIFIPAGTLQQVRTYGRSLSVVFSLTPLKFYNECKPEMSDKLYLNETQLSWSWSNGTTHFLPHKWTPKSLYRAFLSLLRLSDKLYIEQFADFYLKASRKSSPTLDESWNLFKELDEHFKGHITRGELEKITQRKLEWLCSVLNDAELVDTVERRKDEL